MRIRVAVECLLDCSRVSIYRKDVQFGVGIDDE